jgi:Spy/CpxP family protein refolding chaperone
MKRILLFILLALAGTTYAQIPNALQTIEQRATSHTGKLDQIVSLTPAQQTQVKNLMTKTLSSKESALKQHGSGTPNYNNAVSTINANHAQELQKILTPDQIAKLQQNSGNLSQEESEMLGVFKKK